MATSREIIEGSPDLKRLFEDGFEISVRGGHLLVTSVPYVTAERRVARGTLVFPLTLTTDNSTGKPPDHTAYFAGSYPCFADGTPLSALRHADGSFALEPGVVAKFKFSNKGDYDDADYNGKVRRYVDALCHQAQVLEPGATAQTRRVVETEADDSPFVYQDTNSARAQITSITSKLTGQKIAIVGLGGTGSYILDLVTKTPVAEIHLFDDDEFSLHNSYRAPGTPTRDQLRARMRKVDYLFETYRRMHKGIHPHPERVTGANASTMNGMSFAFLCMDPGPDKAALVNHLVASGIPFVDSGIAVEKSDDKLVGLVSAITVTSAYHSHVAKIPVKPPGDDELYSSNIQIAELNALNATLAVMRWKKHVGFYADDRREHEVTYTVGSNMLQNEEIAPRT